MFKNYARSIRKRILTHRRRSLAAGSIAMLSVVGFSLGSLGMGPAHPRGPDSGQTVARQKTQPQNHTYTLYSGLWRTDGSFVSTIRIKNVLVVAPLDVTPVLFMADGTPYMLPSVHVPVSGVATVSVNDALAAAPQPVASHISQSGSVALLYIYSSPGHLSAQVAAIDASRSLSYTYAFVEPMAMQGHDSQQVLEGLWWKRDQGISGFVALSNTTDQQQTATLTPVHPANSANPRQVALAPHSTQMLSLEEFDGNVSLPDNRAGGIRVEYEGTQGAILVTGGLVNESEGYSANIPFWFHDMSSATPTTITYAGAGLMVGKPDPMMMPGFPKDTSFSPYLALRNTTEKPLDVALQVNYMMGMEGSMPVTRNLPTLHLAPFEARQPDLQGSLTAARLKNFSGSLNLSVSFTGKGGDLVLATGSVDQTGTYVFEVGPQGVASTNSKYSNYWGVAHGNDTMFSLWNPTDTPQDILATFSYGDGSGKYTLPVHLDPQASTMIDMAMLIMEKRPDADGNVFPSTIQEGSAQFASAKGGHEKITVVISAGVFNVTTATCGESCITCCGDSGFAISPDPIFCPINEGMQCSATGTDCYGNTIFPTVTAWSSSNSSIMTVNSSGYVQGIAVGQVTISAQFAPVIVYTGQVCAPSPYCPTSSPGAGSPATVMSLTCSPSSVTRGSSTTCTVNNAPSGAAFSNWKFTDSGGNVVTSNNSNSSWSGTIVTGGTVSVTVSGSGSSADPSATITVTNRSGSGWTFSPASATQENNGFSCSPSGPTLSIPSPPSASFSEDGTTTGDLGMYCNTDGSSFNTATVNDGGPNNGYQYVTSVSPGSSNLPWAYYYVISPDLQNPSSAFSVAQCGNYNAQTNPNGFISQPNLLSNTTRHESGTTASHYAQYTAAVNASANNPGTVAEQQVGAPGLTVAQFGGNVTNALNSAATSINSATKSPEPPGPNYSANGTFQGYTNFPPYASCQ